MAKRMNIALLAGGNSSEYEVSIGSAAQVIEVLNWAKYTPWLIKVKDTRWFYTDPRGRETDVNKNDFSLELDGEKIFLEYALILIHGTPGEDGLMQAYFEMMEIPFSSSGFLTSAVTFDKSACKRMLAPTGVALAREILLTRGDAVNVPAVVAELGLPLFVKPNASGSSCGVSKVKRAEELLPAIEVALSEGDQVIIEEFIAGTEVSCGVMVTGGQPTLFPATEIVSKNEFFDYQAKYTPGMSEEITPARIPESETRELNRLSLLIYQWLRCRGVVRIDYIIQQGTPFLIEINTVPGMSAGSIIPKQAAAIGMTLTELFDKIISDTLK
ncbi:MAG: D-alanine--D-alanine ligase [Rikenellaceae bacterium]|jgi:D-alanine-D-alanine ligase|nr:D-alanine--D-alanine ligase [Rikenellaceae bacterium]